ncbi:MAG: tRNA glutamyl-Q(34) synthetase GluQRS [Halioglobus sp.]
MPTPPVSYRGRFAPSPTGPLHLGSLIAALASFLDARHYAGAWLVRMEDLDPPREEAGAAERILTSLQRHGLCWDEPVLYQSTRYAAYAQALKTLQQAGLLFTCRCTRAQIGAEGTCCGACRHTPGAPVAGRAGDRPGALRLAVPPDARVAFTDALQGTQHSALGQQLADFVVKRKDGLYAYQLAVVVDDFHQGISHVVRGADLLDSTPRQIALQQALGYPTPAYCHIPLITTRSGQKFSKQNNAPALDDSRAAHNLRLALDFLGQTPPPTELTAVDDILRFATAGWAPGRIPGVLSIPAAQLGVTA